MQKIMARRVAREDTVAARRRAHAGRTVRTADLEAADPEHAVLAAAGHEHLLLVVGFGERAALERDANLVRTGRRREANVLEPRVDLLHDAVFFFQAEDGIRDFHVTGVQTCALPICCVGTYSVYPRERGYVLGPQAVTSHVSREERPAIRSQRSIWSGVRVTPPEAASLDQATVSSPALDCE